MDRVVIRYNRIICFIIIAHFTLGKVLAEEECLGKDKELISCYECDSRQEPLCADPFNNTLRQTQLPPVAHCKGCCIKIVRMKGTKYEWVWRTCTQKIKINLFIVDHVCMYESNQIGHMCFCEEDLCNEALNSLKPMSPVLLLAFAFISVYSLMLHEPPF